MLVTYLIGTFAKPRGVFTLGVWCFSGFASLFPLVFAAVYWKRATKAGAYACVLAAAGTWLLLRELNATRAASVVGAAIFAFSGSMVSMGNLLNLLDTAAFP